MQDHIAWGTISGYHSALAGLLAGFVFAAISLLISNPPEGKRARDISSQLFLLLVVFLSLIVASFLYATATGEKTASGPVVANVFASFVFSLAAVEMFVGMTLFFHEYGLDPRVVASTALLTDGVLLIAALNIATTIGNSTAALEGRDYLRDPLTLLWVLPVVGLPALAHWWRRRRRKSRVPGPERVRRLAVWSLRYVIGMAVYCGVVLGTPEALQTTMYPTWMRYPLMLLLGLLLARCELVLPAGE